MIYKNKNISYKYSHIFVYTQPVQIIWILKQIHTLAYQKLKKENKYRRISFSKQITFTHVGESCRIPLTYMCKKISKYYENLNISVIGDLSIVFFFSVFKRVKLHNVTAIIYIVCKIFMYRYAELDSLRILCIDHFCTRFPISACSVYVL